MPSEAGLGSASRETPRAVEIFFSYAHEDQELMDQVRRQLVVFDRQGMIRKWHDRLIAPGQDWKAEIDSRLQHSDIVLLFLSPDFFESDYCYEVEMAEALRRHRLGLTCVIPVILRPCAWSAAPIARLQALPAEGRAITLWPNRDEACLAVAEGIMRVVRAIRGEGSGGAEGERVGDAERRLAVRVHRAYFVGNPVEFYFINLTNLSPRRTLEVTHVWYEADGVHIPVAAPSRPLPVRLDLDESWETWIAVTSLPPSDREEAFGQFRARLSNGMVVASERNVDVPPMGTVPGGRTDGGAESGRPAAAS